MVSSARRVAGVEGGGGVSIPFIAGQWSLRLRAAAMGYVLFGFQSPSLRGSGLFAEERARQEAERASFNPLHCGAVVSS